MMNLRIAVRSFSLVVIAAIGVVLGAADAPAAMITADARARYGTGNTTIGEQEAVGVLLSNDGTTGLQEAANTHLTAAAEGVSSLSNSAIGGGSFWLGASVVDSPNGTGGTVWNLNAMSSTGLEDTIAVNSSTLPAGTPVEVQFSLYAAASTFVDHSHGVSMNNNFGFVNSSISGFARVATNTVNRFDIVADDHHIIRDTTGDTLPESSGLLNPNTPRLDFVLEVEVGQEIELLINIRTQTSGRLSPYFVGPDPTDQENAAGKVVSAIGLALGAAPSSSEITLQSELFDGPFPAASEANAANAALALPVVAIPEPSSVSLLAIAATLLTRRRA